jgi:hypothetical protein
MIKRGDPKAASRAPLRPLPNEALRHVTGGSSPSIDVETQTPVVWMREIVHIQ